jgi:O-antigen ligase
MRLLAQWLLAAYAYTIPWEYSLDWGEPWGNIARIVGLLLLLAAVPALLNSGKPLPLSWTHAFVLALYLWFCLSGLWSMDQAATLGKLRAFFQEMMIVFLAWEFVRTARELRWLLRAVVAGCWTLALLTLAAFRSAEALATTQMRAVATGQDPNDVARFLALGMPLAALLAHTDPQRALRWAAWIYLPAALLATLLTASRGGLVAAFAALAGSAILLLNRRPRLQRASLVMVPILAAILWKAIPAGIIQRLSTLPEQLQSGNLNERVSIWQQGWRTFGHAPFLGYGAGTFTQATSLYPEDTAHNTALALLLAGGVLALFLATAIAGCALHAAWRQTGPLRVALLTALGVFALTALAASVEENRFTWLLVAVAAIAGRMRTCAAMELAACFPRDPVPAASTGAELELP